MRLAKLNVGDVGLGYQAVRREEAPKSSVKRMLATAALWRERAKQRAELARLDRVLRQDIGITEADVWREVRKFPWQA